MAELRLTINLDNEAFAGYPRTELSRIFRHLASVIEEHGLPDYARPVMDRNGNQCGTLVFDDDPAE